MMKLKRVLLVVTIGISFAPPVFASSDLSQYRPSFAHTGEMGSDDINYTATQCQLSEVLKGSDQDSRPAAGAVGAGSAAR